MHTHILDGSTDDFLMRHLNHFIWKTEYTETKGVGIAGLA